MSYTDCTPFIGFPVPMRVDMNFQRRILTMRTSDKLARGGSGRLGGAQGSRPHQLQQDRGGMPQGEGAANHQGGA
jgi:hypothetical protein